MIDKALAKENCMGCKMCGDICPKQAIRFEVQHDGFWYPSVNYEKCVKCGLCIKKCPIINETINKSAFQPEVYAAWLLDEEIRLKSTSGGMYWALAQNMLGRGGYIVGCVFSEDWKSAYHIVGNTQEDLDKVFRSKYFQSDTAGIYIKVKRLLDSGERVLFCGTPCQNAALIEFLGKDYENLIQVDFICRGINSPKAHYANCVSMERKHNSKITFFNFKNKTKGWTSLGVLVKFENGDMDFSLGSSDNAYIRAYNNGNDNFCMRPACSDCRFKKIPRVSDFSIGDFWGIQGVDEKDMYNGISCVMINTAKGKDFFDTAKPLLHVERRDFEEMSRGNRNLTECPRYGSPEKRVQFFKRIETEDFDKVVWSMLKHDIYKKRIMSAVRKFVPKSIKVAYKRLKSKNQGVK